MSAPVFSLGPWRVRRRPNVDPDVVDAEGYGVAIQGGGYQSAVLWDANARLIAAAPEMLALLAGMVVSEGAALAEYPEIRALVASVYAEAPP